MDNKTININRRTNTKEAMKAVKTIARVLGVFLVIIILLSQSIFIVNEHEQAVVKRLGTIKRIVIDSENTFIEDNPNTMNVEGAKITDVSVDVGKGLFFKIPFIDKVEKYDSWLYTYVSTTEQVNTSDKRRYYITMYAQWRIANPGLFAVSQKNTRQASVYLDNRIFPEIIQNVNNTKSSDFINNKELWNQVMSDAQANINGKIKDSGIEILDMQVHRTILPEANIQSTYDKMIANREKIAQQHRSQGEAHYTKEVSSADRRARELVAGAILESEQIIGDGEAEALGLYATSYSIDPKFYAYWRSLQALETSLEDNTTLVLDDTHPLWADLLEMATWDSATGN